MHASDNSSAGHNGQMQQSTGSSTAAATEMMKLEGQQYSIVDDLPCRPRLLTMFLSAVSSSCIDRDLVLTSMPNILAHHHV